jgi:hypothetical protein
VSQEQRRELAKLSLEKFRQNSEAERKKKEDKRTAKSRRAAERRKQQREAAELQRSQ